MNPDSFEATCRRLAVALAERLAELEPALQAGPTVVCGAAEVRAALEQALCEAEDEVTEALCEVAQALLLPPSPEEEGEPFGVVDLLALAFARGLARANLFAEIDPQQQ